jgi:hypothetical protein
LYILLIRRGNQNNFQADVVTPRRRQRAE